MHSGYMYPLEIHSSSHGIVFNCLLGGWIPMRRLLTGTEPKTMAQTLDAIDILHSMGPRTVVVTSSELPAGQSKSMLMIVSCAWGEAMPMRTNC